MCIATYRRPQQLDRLLGGIAEQEFAREPPELSVIVVDNDPGDEAIARVIDSHRDALPAIVLTEEPRQGISFARNRALETVGDTEFIAFIDDDEVPEAGWLDELLAVQRDTDADVVCGPVLARYEETPAEWIRRGGFFERPRYLTGERIDHAFTHNTLVRWEPFARTTRFAPRYARSGGSDAHYFDRLRRDGAVVVWADRATVCEWNPPSRLRLSWLLRRHYRIGLMRAVIDAELRPGVMTRLHTAQQGYRRIFRGMTQLATSALGPRHEQARALTRMASGVGRMAALAGLWFEEYT